jgi:hypothetical protein
MFDVGFNIKKNLQYHEFASNFCACNFSSHKAPSKKKLIVQIIAFHDDFFKI